MTKDQIGAVLDRVQQWPKARQEDAARILLAMEAEPPSSYVLNEEERADLEAALAEVAGGDIASHDEVDDVFARHRA